MGFDTGDDTVEVILRSHYYAQVLKDLKLGSLTESPSEIAKMDAFFSEIGALARHTSDKRETLVMRFDILRSAW